MARPGLGLTVAAAALILLAFHATQVEAQSPGTPRRLAFATHAIARGAVLGADDIEYRDTTSRGMTDTSKVSPGWVTRRVITAGEVLRSPAVEPPIVIAANEQVDVEWRDQDVRLTVRGTATRNAAMGERVTVRTEQGQRVEAVVVAPGRVRID